MLAIGITNQTAMNALIRVFENTSGRTDLSVTLLESNEEGISQEDLRLVQSVPGVAAAIPVLRAVSALAGGDVPSQLGLGMFGANAGGLVLNGIDPVLDLRVRNYKVTEGRFLLEDPGGAEIVLGEDYAIDQKIKVGQWVGLLTPNGVERLRVVGLIARDGAGLTNNGTFGVLPIRKAQELFNRKGELDQIDILASSEISSAKKIDVLQAELQNRLGQGYAVVYPAGQGQRQSQMLGSYQIGLNFMSGIALFVGAFLIYNAFAMNVVERTREFGMLRTIGMTRRQIVGQVVAEAGVLGIAGSGMGLLLGIGLAAGLTRMMAVILNQELGGVVIPLDSLFTSLAVGVLTTLLAAAIPALQAGRVSPIEALRSRGQVREVWLIRHGWRPGMVLFVAGVITLIANPFPNDTQFRLGTMAVFALFLGLTLLIPSSVAIWERLTRPMVKFLYGSTGQLGSRNIRRSRQRTTLTVAALMIGVSMVIVTQVMTGSFSADLKNWMASYIGGDLYVGSSVAIRPEVRGKLEAMDGIETVAPIRQFEVEWVQDNNRSEKIQFMAFDPASYTRVTQITFNDSSIDSGSAVRQLAAGGSVFLSSVLAERFHVKPGEKIILRTRRGLKPFIVAAEVVDFSNQGLVIQGSWKDMKRYFLLNDATTYLVKTTPGTNIDDLKQRVDDLYGKRYQLILESNVSIRERALRLMDQAFALFDVLAMISIVVASLGVINTLTMNVIERTREIGMLRAIGMQRGQVVGMILAEAALMGIIGGMLGLGAGIVQAWVFLKAMVSMSGYRLDFILPQAGVVVAVGIALIVSQIAAVFPAIRATRTHILDAIHYE